MNERRTAGDIAEALMAERDKFEEPFEVYACEYVFQGERWAFHLHARDRAEAEARLRTIAQGIVLGPVAKVIPFDRQ